VNEKQSLCLGNLLLLSENITVELCSPVLLFSSATAWPFPYIQKVNLREWMVEARRFQQSAPACQTAFDAGRGARRLRLSGE
jgi:hypothetical protein